MRTEQSGAPQSRALVAKPIIDILLGIARLKPTAGEIAAMEAIGYAYPGE